MPAVVPPLSSGPRGPGEGLCLQDPGLLALGSGLAHHLRCSRLGSGAPGITGWPSGERVRILGCSPSLNGGETGPDAGVLPRAELCWRHVSPGRARRWLWVWAGQSLFLPQAPHLCSSQFDSASHPPPCRAGQGPPGLPIPAPRALLLGVSFEPPSGSGRRSPLKLAGDITLMGSWPNGEASCFEIPRLPGATAQVPWGRGTLAPPRQAWDRCWHPGISLPVCFLAGE